MHSVVPFFFLFIVTPLLSISDARKIEFDSSMSESLKSGGNSALTSGDLIYTIEVSLSEGLYGTTFGLSPILTFSSLGTGTYTASGLTTGIPTSGFTTWTYTVTVSGILVQDDTFIFSILPGSVTRATDQIQSINTVSINVLIDITPPTIISSANLTIGTYAAASGTPFFMYIPKVFASDNGLVSSPVSSLNITSATTNDIIGLSVNTGVLGLASISGTALNVPSTRFDLGMRKKTFILFVFVS